jgi:IS30 family transposase
MKKFEHLNFSHRKIINNQITTHNATAIKIAQLIGYDPTTISKELKRNRYVSKEAPSNVKDPICKKTLRFPYVCNGCHKKDNCNKRQYKYEATRANQYAKYRLIVSRQGIDLSPEEHKTLDQALIEGLADNKSIYHIVKSNSEIKVSIPTVYRYIKEGIVTVTVEDLPHGTVYKKRKKSNKKYDYSQNTKIDRSNRIFIDYLAYLQAHPNVFVVEMDFLGSIKSDAKSILTLIIKNLHFVMLFLIENKNSAKVVNVFNSIQGKIGIEAFQKVFPVILTDRDPCFYDYEGIEADNETGELRTRLFYCDAFKSNQKPSVENMNNQLRRYFPKRKSIDNLTEQDMFNVMNYVNNLKISSLSGATPNEAFIRVYGEDILNNLMK